MGSNDIRDAFLIYAAGGNGGPILDAALGSIAANIQRLYLAGAREFLVWVVPNVALTPAIRSLASSRAGLGGIRDAAVQRRSCRPFGAVVSWSFPESSFARLDAYQILNAIVANPAAFDLTNVTTACLTPNIAPFNCKAR